MANDLNLNTVELASTLRTAPLNGAPSSSDYNSSARETLVDLASLAGFINDTVLPLINALSASALLPTASPVGIEGRTVWADTSDHSTIFFDSLADVPLSIADALRVLNGIITTLQQQLTDQGVEVASLQARLASTNQNDIALALQNLTTSLNQLTNNQLSLNATIVELQNRRVVTVRSVSTPIVAGAMSNIVVTFPTAYLDNFYTVSTQIEVVEGAIGVVSVGGLQKNGVGVGVTVGVVNNDSITHNVILHVMAQHD